MGLFKKKKTVSKEYQEWIDRIESGRKPLDDPSNYFHCPWCNKKLHVSDPTVTFCKYCKTSFCKEDSPVTEHNCSLKYATKSQLKELFEETDCLACKKEKKVLGTFFCKYCRRWYCEEHRNPEDHYCEGKLDKPSVDVREITEMNKTRFEY